MVKRIDRVNELIQQELNKILEEHFRNEGVLVTVSYVKTAPDLRAAKAFISILPFNKAPEMLEKLKEEFPKFQLILSQTIELKYIPKIELELDESLEYEDKIQHLIDKTKDDKMSS